MQFGGVEVEEAVTSLCRIADSVMLHGNGVDIRTTEPVKVHENHSRGLREELVRDLDLFHIHCALVGQEKALEIHNRGALVAQEKGLDSYSRFPLAVQEMVLEIHSRLEYVVEGHSICCHGRSWDLEKALEILLVPPSQPVFQLPSSGPLLSLWLLYPVAHRIERVFGHSSSSVSQQSGY